MTPKQKRIKGDLEAWFREPPDMPSPFVGVIVFVHPKNPTVKVAVAAHEFMVRRYHAGGYTMPFTAQPHKVWNNAPAIGYADNLADALKLMGIES